MKRQLATLAAMAVLLAGCAATYGDRTDDLNKQFEMGQRSRQLMEQRKAPVTETTCRDMWVESGAKGHHEHAGKSWSGADYDAGESGQTYKDLRNQYFVNGCMDRAAGMATPAASPSGT